MKAFIFTMLIGGILGLGACTASSNKPTPGSNYATPVYGTPMPNFTTPTPPAPGTSPKPTPKVVVKPSVAPH